MSLSNNANLDFDLSLSRSWSNLILVGSYVAASILFYFILEVPLTFEEVDFPPWDCESPLSKELPSPRKFSAMTTRAWEFS